MRLKIHHIRMLSSISPIATAPSDDSDTKSQARTTTTAKDEKNKKTGKARLDSSGGGCEDNDKETTPDPAACCPICREPVGQPTAEGIVEAWAALPCGHRYGHYCIKTWLGMADQPSCPICRIPMVHLCRHPVLPVVVVVAPRWLVLLGGGSSRLNIGSNITSRSDGGGGIVLLENTKNWRWRGRDPEGMCGFCAVSRMRWPQRVAVFLGRFVLTGLDPRRLRGRRRVATAIELEQAQQQQPHGQEGAQGIQPIFYADHEDPWRAAFEAWWAQQEPRTTEPASRAEGGDNAGGVLIL